jgi:hypothetical protein
MEIKLEPKDVSRKHFYISLVKSSFRIIAGILLIKGDIVGAGMMFITAEILGVLEEL